ncbi:hypothetical protein [Sphingobium cloacae]|uniref:Uncharacterized protein n=1 Tax=Sphingobium cloacae TaxID=120107 RepID=A0A1E1EYJ7_9SPHN|nr:hypothetical protein [Sphingobium cloacae]BAV63334.1 hypothetical protein SCLO_1002940 [Sphingobium cloacae]
MSVRPIKVKLHRYIGLSHRTAGRWPWLLLLIFVSGVALHRAVPYAIADYGHFQVQPLHPALAQPLTDPLWRIAISATGILIALIFVTGVSFVGAGAGRPNHVQSRGERKQGEDA